MLKEDKVHSRHLSNLEALEIKGKLCSYIKGLKMEWRFYFFSPDFILSAQIPKVQLVSSTKGSLPLTSLPYFCQIMQLCAWVHASLLFGASMRIMCN